MLQVRGQKMGLAEETGCWQGCVPSGSSRGEYFPSAFSVSTGHLSSLVLGLSSHLPISNCNILTSTFVITSSLTFDKYSSDFLFTFKNLHDYTGPMPDKLGYLPHLKVS